ncbi:MAG: Na/Pi cotransporter family protein [Alphaproteobacteria bacterium]|nr:Na/Pi cotransporter family protein [Alphaproteobacteria bacterium]
MPSIILLHILGSVFLLLFGLSQVRNGITHAFGYYIRKAIEHGTKNRFAAFFSGIAVTAFLQSSMATTLIISSFAGQGLIKTSAAIAVVLGADVGTTLVAQVLTIDLSGLSYVMVIIGYLMYRHDKEATIRQLGSVFMGLGLMLLSLGLIKEAAIPLRQSEILPIVLEPLAEDTFFAILVGGLLTWIFHSSLAFVLLTASLTATGVVPVHLGILLVLGANLGGVMAPLTANLRDSRAALRIPLANILMRLVGVIAAVFLIDEAVPYFKMVSEDPSRLIVNAHMFFNIAVGIIFLPFLSMVASFVKKICPDRDMQNDPSTPKYLDMRVLHTPTVALTNASREALRIADFTVQMMQTAWEAFQKNNRSSVEKAKALDVTIDNLYKELKKYLVILGQESLTEAEARQHFQILTFATNLEHIGDIIDKSLLAIAEKKIKYNLSFSKDGEAELDEFARCVLESMRLAQTVFMTNDVALAQKLIDEKLRIKKVETQNQITHMTRLQQGVPETIATSDIHMDIVRDLRRVNSLITTIAYPLLKDAQAMKPENF